jgi:hypothetical protein
MAKTSEQRKAEIEAIQEEVRQAGAGGDKAAQVKAILAKSSAGLRHKDGGKSTISPHPNQAKLNKRLNK